MAITYSAAVKNARMDAVLAEIDGGAATGGGDLQIGTTGMATVLASWTLTDPAGTVTGSVLNFDMDPDLTTTGLNNGTPTEGRIRDSDGTVCISGLTVGTTGTEVILDAATITSGQTLTMTLGSITHV